MAFLVKTKMSLIPFGCKMPQFKSLSGASNGILDKFMIYVPDCRKLNEKKNNGRTWSIYRPLRQTDIYEKIYELAATRSTVLRSQTVCWCARICHASTELMCVHLMCAHSHMMWTFSGGEHREVHLNLYLYFYIYHHHFTSLFDSKIQLAMRKGKRSATRSDAKISTVSIDSTDRHADGNRLSGIGMPITKSSSNLWIVAHVIRMTKVRYLLCGRRSTCFPPIDWLLTRIYYSQFSISIILSVTITTSTNTTCLRKC